MKKAVLAVDDSKTVLNVIELCLRDEYDVILATSGDQAFQILQKRTVDIILLDIVMPVMDGLVVLKKLREMEAYRDIPVLFLTGDAHRATVVESFRTGSQGYILKPVKKENLLQRIDEIIRKQKERLERKAEDEKKQQAEKERKRQEAEAEEKRRKEEEERKRKEAAAEEKQKEEKQKEEKEKMQESVSKPVENQKENNISEEILVKPVVEDLEEMEYDPFEDLGDILENFVKADEDTE